MTGRCPLVTRRHFIAGLGATILTAACGGRRVSVFGPDPTAPDAAAVPTIPAGTFPRLTDRTLVVVELGGGNDGFATVVPHQSGRLRDLRRSTFVDDAVDLDGEVGLHPALATVAAQYGAGTVAIVEGVGAPKPDLSHFVSMRRWWDGTHQPDHTGWLGRYLDGAAGYDDLLAGITIGYGPSQAMLGRGSFVVNIAGPEGLAAEWPWWIDEPDELLAAWAGFAPVGMPLAELTPLQRAISSTVEAQRRLESGLAPLRSALEADGEEFWELDELVGQLTLAAGLITSGVGPQVIFVHGAGDFDTHEDQRSRHGELLTALDRGLAGFWSALGDAGMADRAVVMTTSEFGRRPEDNDGGTDHGTAGAHFVMGPAVAGGRYGEAPSLDRLDDEGNPVHTVDYRSLYATVLDGWLEAPAAEILHRDYETLPLFRA